MHFRPRAFPKLLRCDIEPENVRLTARLKGTDIRWTPHPVIVTIMDYKDHIRVLLYSYYTMITGWGVLRQTLGFCLGVGMVRPKPSQLM